jgi:uncharacterized protein YecA (UPF0149 family)
MKRPADFLIEHCKRDLDMIYDYVSPLTKAMRSQILEPIRTTPRILPNDPCICGSGRKYKKCCKLKNQ